VARDVIPEFPYSVRVVHGFPEVVPYVSRYIFRSNRFPDRLR